MFILRSFVFRLALVIVLTAAGPFSSAQDGSTDKEQMEQMIRDSRFGLWRNLVEYLAMLRPEFAKALAELRPGELWVDLGHGNGIALRQYLVWTDAEFHRAVDEHRDLHRKTKERLHQFHLPPLNERGDVYGIGYHTPQAKYFENLFARVNQLDRASERYGEITGEFFKDMDRKKLKKVFRRAKLVTSVYGILDYETDFLPTFSFIMNNLPSGCLVTAAMFGNTLAFADESGVEPSTVQGGYDFEWIKQTRQRWLDSFKGAELLGSSGDLSLTWRRTTGPVSWAAIKQINLIYSEPESPARRVFQLTGCSAELQTNQAGSFWGRLRRRLGFKSLVEP